MDSRIIYQGAMCTLRTASLADATEFAVNVRAKEVYEMHVFGVRSSVIGTELSVRMAEKVCAITESDTGLVLCMGGVNTITNNKLVSRNMGILSGRGGYLWQLSRPESTKYKHEIVRRHAGAYLDYVGADYDFLTFWVADFMDELKKMVRIHRFIPIEFSHYNEQRFIRMERRR